MNEDINASSSAKVVETKTGDICASSPAPKVLLPVTDLGYGRLMHKGAFTICYVYPKNGKPFIVKGAGAECTEAIERQIGDVPYIEHSFHYKREYFPGRKNYWSYIRIRLPDHIDRKYWFSLEKRHDRPLRDWEKNSMFGAAPVKVPNKHERWILSVREMGSKEPAKILASFRQPPRAWIRHLDPFLEG